MELGANASSALCVDLPIGIPLIEWMQRKQAVVKVHDIIANEVVQNIVDSPRTYKENPENALRSLNNLPQSRWTFLYGSETRDRANALRQLIEEAIADTKIDLDGPTAAPGTSLPMGPVAKRLMLRSPVGIA